MLKKSFALLLALLAASAPAGADSLNVRLNHKRLYSLWDRKSISQPVRPLNYAKSFHPKAPLFSLRSRIAIPRVPVAQNLSRRPMSWLNRGILRSRIIPLALAGVCIAALASCGGGGDDDEDECSSRGYYDLQCPVFDYRGSNGKDGSDGSSGNSIYWNGENGQNGQNGGNGKNVVVTLTASDDLSLVFIKAQDGSGATSETIHPASDTSRRVIIRADGGRGGDGGNGGSAYFSSDGPANGGQGGDGGDGGDGAVVTLQYTHSFLIDYIQVMVDGGKGGDGGHGGSGHHTGWNGFAGQDGQDGTAGFVIYQPL